MPNNSATGGYLQPTTVNGELNDDALDDFLQRIVVGITGLPGSLVFPRWQPEPPNIPPFGTDWAAIGEMSSDPDYEAADIHQSSGDGDDLLFRQEIIEVLASFYGPNSRTKAEILSMGFQVAQNREQMQLNGYGLVEVGKPLRTAELIKERFLPRVDLSFRLRRGQVYAYPVLNLLGAQGTITSDQPALNVLFSVNALSGATLPLFAWGFQSSTLGGWGTGNWA